MCHKKLEKSFKNWHRQKEIWQIHKFIWHTCLSAQECAKENMNVPDVKGTCAW